MSLETKIAELTKAVEALTQVILNDVKTDIQAEAEKVISQAKEVEVEQITPTTDTSATTDDIKALCLKIARTVDNGKDKAKEVLKSVGAVKATDVKGGDIPTVITKLEALL